MSTIELKSSIHKIVDRIQSEQLLQTIYDFLKTNESSNTGKLWKSLSDEQRREVLLSFDESEDNEGLIDATEFFKRVNDN